ncbi:MAG: hypothetical protein ACNA7Q_14030 [Rhodobacterales bacterium]
MAQALNGIRIDGAQVHAQVSPVDFAAIAQMMPALIDRHRPRLIISLGLWPGEAMIRVERVASNWSWFALPDNTGHRQQDRSLRQVPATNRSEYYGVVCQSDHSACRCRIGDP